ncbi:MAG: dUTP diphosphatase [Patescibacteria group bacterium]
MDFSPKWLNVLDPTSKECISELPFVLEPGERALFGIGIQFATPWPIECQVRPRSGLSSKYGIDLGNSPGTVDPDFRGNIGVLLYNRGNKMYTINKGDRIAQLVFSEVRIPTFEEVDELPPTRRGIGGFGSTGTNIILEGTEDYDREVRQWDRFYMNMAIGASDLSNCARGCRKGEGGEYLRDDSGRLIGQTRKFGCVIVKDANIVSFGYNAMAEGQPLCSEVGCLRDEKKIPSGTQIEICRAVHAEQMAVQKMLRSGVGTPTEGAIMYVTAEPCLICAILISGLGLETLVVLEGVYPTNGLEIVKKSGISVRYVGREVGRKIILKGPVLR